MKTAAVVAGLVGGAVVLIGIGVLVARQPREANGEAPAGGDGHAHGEDPMAPMLGETMTRIQAIFADLYYSADAKNWPLVDYHLHELEETFARVPLIRPEENGVPLKPTVDIVLGTTIPALEAAADRKDYASFLNRYMDAISTCNACHAQTGHGYLVVKVPSEPHTKTLDFEPSPAP